MKVALVYDRVNKWGGAERLLRVIMKIWPEAIIFTSVYNPQTASWAKDLEIKASFLNSWPLAKSNHEMYPLMMPLAFESFNFSGFDLVISLTSEAAKGIITKPETKHLCYCLTPTRYLWSGYQDYFAHYLYRALARPLIGYLKYWDQKACFRPDAFLAISKVVKNRIKTYYRQGASVIYPPVDSQKWQPIPNPQEDYYLVVSRLVGYKKVDLVIKAFNQLGWPLKIVGSGRMEKKLKRIAKRNIEFLGELTDDLLLSYYQNCSAVIFPPEEDFGLVPLEAQSCGRPVIAFGKGGALETVVEGKTGLFFRQQKEGSLIKALKKFGEMKFNPADCRQNALLFGEKRFMKEFKNRVMDLWKN